MLLTFYQNAFRFHVYQNNIAPDLSDAFPGDDKLMISSDNPPDFAGTGDDQTDDTSGADVEFDITDKTESFPVPSQRDRR